MLLEIENTPLGTTSTNPNFATFISNSAEIMAPLGVRPGFRAGPTWSPDGKQVVALLAGVTRDKAGLVIVRNDGGAVTNLVGGENGLEPGTRLGPSFSSDGSKLFYWFQSAPGKDKVLRSFDLNSKKETNVLSGGDLSFPACCGLNK